MDTLFSTQLQRESDKELLVQTLRYFADEAEDAFSGQDIAWLRLEHSGYLPPVLGALNEQVNFEAKLRRSVIHGYQVHLQKVPPRPSNSENSSGVSFRPLTRHSLSSQY
jgi:hypothetical protein